MTAVRFENAKVLTLDQWAPVESALLVQDGIIQAAGTADDVVDLYGATVVPGFIDNHCHLMAMATWSASVECGPAYVGSIDQLISRLWGAEPRGNSDWIFGVGYDDLLMAERRHPTAVDLDRVTTTRPILLTHSSGHAHVMNTRGMALLGITASSEEPRGGAIDRVAETGEPSGLLLEMGEYIASQLPRRTNSEQVAAVESSLHKLASVGVTTSTDAGHRNDVASLGTMAVAGRRSGVPRLQAMLRPGIKRDLPGEDQTPLATYTKVMLTGLGGTMSLGLDQLRELATAEHAIGSPGIAIHAVETDVVNLAARLANMLSDDLPSFIVRIEHASKAPADTLSAVKHSGATIVTQPGFIWSRGDRYVATGSSIDELYPLRDWLSSQVPLAYGSDAPYGPISPVTAIQAAATRRSSSGQLVGGTQAIDAAEALSMVTRSGDGRQRTLRPGESADFVVLSGNPITIESDRIGEIQVIATYVAGRKIWPLSD